MLDKALAGEITTRLVLADFPARIKEPWEKAFGKEKVRQAWRRDGLTPFNRQCYWNMVNAEGKPDAQRAQADARAAAVNAVHGMR